MVDFCLWFSNGGVLHRGDDEDLKEMLSNFSKRMFLFWP